MTGTVKHMHFTGRTPTMLRNNPNLSPGPNNCPGPRIQHPLPPARNHRIQRIASAYMLIGLFSYLPLLRADQPAAQSAELRPIRGAIPQPFWETPWPYIIIGLVVIVGVAIYVIKRITGGQSQPKQLTPFDTAMAQLQQARKFMIDKQDKAFSSLVSDTIRQYIEARFSINAPEQTTEEFLAVAAQHPVLKQQTVDQLSDFLELCDQVKFAQQSFGDAQREAQYHCAEQFLRASETQIAKTQNK